MRQISARKRRHIRVREKVKGDSQRPRLSVCRSLRHLYAQIIDDIKGHTLVSASTLEGQFKEKCTQTGNVQSARYLGQVLAQRAKALGIKKVVFDRGGFVYHGRVKALAESAREAGLEF